MWMLVEAMRVCEMRLALRERKDRGKENEVQWSEKWEGNQ